MLSNKKRIREEFHNSVLVRDKNKCRVCGAFNEKLDAHHITDRKEIIFGGYVPENGISLCEKCHINAEVFHKTGTALPGWAPNDLYKIIGSSYETALSALKTKFKLSP